MVDGYNASSRLGTLAFDLMTDLRANASMIVTNPPDVLPLTMAPTNTESLRVVRYAVQKVCVPLVVALGVVGNTLNVIVLTRRSMVSSTSCYLTALAAFDTLYLVCSLTLSLEHYDAVLRSVPYVHWFPYGRVFTDMSANASVLLTVTFTVERYIGVCHPMKGKVLCTPQRAKLIITLVALVAIMCTVPEFFEMEVVWEAGHSGNESYARWKYTDFSATYGYRIGYYWFLVTGFTFLPLVLLCIFNGILVASLFQAAEIRTRMTLTSPQGGLSVRYAREQQRITKMLITVVLVFILCQLPGAVLLMYSAYTKLARVQVSSSSRNELLMAGNVTNLLMQINASINFLLYSMISTKFRRVFCRTFCEHGKAPRPVYRTSTSKSEVIPLSAVLLSSFRRSTLRRPEQPQQQHDGADILSKLLPEREQAKRNGSADGHCSHLRTRDEARAAPLYETCFADTERENC